MKQASMHVSIIIANYNSAPFIENCLKSILKYSPKNSKIIIIDNASTDNSVPLIKKLAKSQSASGKHPQIKLILLKKNHGPAYSRNYAVKKSSGRYLVFLDCDTVVTKNWLKKSIQSFEKNSHLGAAQLKLLKFNQKTHFDSAGEKLSPFGFLIERAQSAKNTGQFDYQEPIFSGKMAATIVKRSIFQKINGFDPDYFMYWEEPDLFWRIWKTNHQVIFLPSGTVYHAFGSQTKPISSQRQTQITYLGCRNHLLTILKNATNLHLIKTFLAVTLSWIGLFFLFTLKLDLQRAFAILRALTWLLIHPRLILQKRKSLQRKLGSRYFQDYLWLPQITLSRPLSWYCNKAIAYLNNSPF